MGKLEGKVALITGGARGQGRSHAVTLAAEGADIVMIDNCIVDVPFQMYPGGSTEELKETEEAVRALGRRCLASVGDVRNSEDLEGIVSRAQVELGGVDILVANAGVSLKLNPLAETPPELWSLTLETNLTGVYNSIRAVLPSMIAQKHGRIIATSSMGGRGGYANAAAYCASKWGVIGLVKCVASEYGQYGITSNAVCPTNVNSPMIHNEDCYAFYVPEVENPTRSQVEDRMAQSHPLGVPYVEPVDISHAIAFLASEDARYITGEALSVSAGSIATNAA